MRGDSFTITLLMILRLVSSKSIMVFVMVFLWLSFLIFNFCSKISDMLLIEK